MNGLSYARWTNPLGFAAFLTLSLCGVPGPFMSYAMGGEFNEILSIGDPAPAFPSLEATDGAKYGLGEFSKTDVLVIAFTCNSCPYAIEYEERLIGLVQELRKDQKSVELIAINSNNIPADQMAAMKERADQRSFPFKYLDDSDHKVAKEFGAVRTPEFFVLNQDRRIVYMGAFDDNTDPNQVKREYVKTAVEAALTKTSVEVQETAPVGCRIRFGRERNQRRD